MADRYILAVESSCDETSVAVLKNEKELLSNIIASQVESHKRFGGVVPEVASRHHVEVVTLCIKDALSEAGIVAEQLDAVAVTYGPGLVGALLVGMAAAKAFAWAHGLPLIPVNHMAGHLMAAREVQELEYPLLALLVSGGHTELVYVSEPGNYKIVGETRDDAVGEAYDKVGRVMGLTYPAGREIDELAHKGKDVYDFPRAMIKEDHLEFSFSGLKSAFINLHHNAEQKGEVLVTEDLCASFQAAVLDILLAKTKKALERYPVKTLVVAGGVAANQGLRERLAEEITDVDVVIPPLRLCGDNAGMIAYDKVGRVMGLTYPAGREIDELAHKGKDVYDFPRAMIKEDHLEFSFSGLKSAFINLHHNAEQKGEVLVTEDLCASFQAAVLDILLAKTKKALERYPVKTLVVAGGVAANQGLRERLAEEITDVDVVIPPLRLCGDNAGMIALAAAIECDKKHFADLDLNAKPSLAFAGFEE